MKYFARSLALAGAVCAAESRTDRAARAVIGQDTFTRRRHGTTSAVPGAAGGAAYAKDTLVVVDSSRIPSFPQNQRAVMYRDSSGQIPGRKALFHTWEL